MNCVLYARVSTNRQAEKDLSIPAQLRLMRQHADREGWSIVEELIESGESGTSSNRPVLQEMLRRVLDRSLHVDAVLAHKLNRVSRNLDDYTQLRRLLGDHGVRLCYVVERVDESPAGRLFENIMASMAQFESANLSEETKKGMRQKVLTGGWPHRPPRGYVSVIRSGDGPRRSTCEVHPTQGPLVAKLFELFATGSFSVQRVVQVMFREGLRSATATPLAHSLVRKMLTNPFYMGRIRWRGLDVQGQHAPLVESAVFHRVQEVLQNRSVGRQHRRPSGLFPLRGIAICAHCRGHMTAERHGAHRYYRCSRQANRHDACAARYCRADRAHSGVERVLESLQLSRDLARQTEKEVGRILRSAPASVATTGPQTLETEALALSTAITDSFLRGSLSPEEFRRSSDSLEETRLHSQRQLHAGRASSHDLERRVADILAMATSLFDLYVTATPVGRSALLRAVFGRVVLGGDGVAGFTLREPFDLLARGSSPEGLVNNLAKSLSA